MKMMIVILICLNICLSIIVIKLIIHQRKENDNIKKLQYRIRKFREFYWVLVRWMEIHLEGIKLNDYFVRNNYQKVAIFGMKEFGQLLYKELIATGVNVPYVIDNNPSKFYTDAIVKSSKNLIDDVDVIVVTAVYGYKEIEADLSKRVNCPIVSLETVIREV